MAYLGVYDKGGCLRYVKINDSDLVDAHVRLLLRMVEGSVGHLDIRTVEMRPTLQKKGK